MTNMVVKKTCGHVAINWIAVEVEYGTSKMFDSKYFSIY